MNEVVISSITNEPKWEKIFQLVINFCDNFEIIYTEDSVEEDNQYIVGKSQFLLLKDISVSPWSGMYNSIAIKGELTDEAKQLFYKYVSPSFKGQLNELWYFNFYYKNQLIMSVQDFTVCIMEKNQYLIEILEKNNIDCSSL